MISNKKAIFARICDEKCSKPKIYLVYLSKLFCFVLALFSTSLYSITRSYYRKESAASSPRDQRQHTQFDE
jgi:hypothetical protein